jgi:hypothetical protein
MLVGSGDLCHAALASSNIATPPSNKPWLIMAAFCGVAGLRILHDQLSSLIPFWYTLKNR